MANRRILILSSYTIALLVCLLAAVLLARVPLAEMVVSRVMQNAGLKNTDVQIARIGANRISLDSLELSRAAASGQYHFHMQDIHIDYNTARLVERRLDRLSIGTVRVRHRVTADKPVESPGPGEPIAAGELLQLVNTDWRAYIPFDALTVERIELEGVAFGVLDHAAVNLSVQKTDGDIETRLSLLNRPGLSRRFTGVLSEKSLDVELHAGDAPGHTALRLKASATAAGMVMHWSLEPDILSVWLSPLLDLADAGSGRAIDGNLDIELVDQDHISARLNLTSGSARFGNYHLARPGIKLVMLTDAELPPRQIQIAPGSHLRFAGVESGSLTIGNTVLRLRAAITKDQERWSMAGDTNTPLLSVSFGSYAFELKDVANHIQADNAQISMRSTFAPASLPGSFRLALTHSIPAATGTATLNMPQAIDLGGADHHLGRLLTVWPFSFDLASGSLQLTTTASWSGDNLDSLHTGIELVNLGGFYEQLLFSGLNFRHEVELLPDIRSTRANELTLAHIDAGVAVENLSARIGAGRSNYGPLPKLHVSGLSGQLLEGSFSAEPFIYDLNSPGNSLAIYMHDIDLAAVVATQQFRDVEVTGRIDGYLPIEINPLGVFVNNGNLHNDTDEGIIRYRPQAGADGLSQNPLTGFALAALSDFHYDRLNANVSYVPDGTLSLAFELNGTSPALDIKRPVNLNLNIEQNLLSLLQSTRYVDGLNRELDERVRQMYRDKTGN